MKMPDDPRVLLVMMFIVACEDLQSDAAENDPESVAPLCDLEGHDAALPLPICDPEVTAVGAQIRGSGMQWHVPAGCRGPLKIVDGPVTLHVASPFPSRCAGGLIVESLTDPTPTSVFALSPIYEFRPADDGPCQFPLVDRVQIQLPATSTESCGEPVQLFDADHQGFQDVAVQLDLGQGSVQVVAARPCPSWPICGLHCTDPAEFSYDEAHCGDCEPCEAVCDQGECIGRGAQLPAVEPEHPSFSSDGLTVYFSELDGETRRLRGVSLENGAVGVEDVGSPDVHIRAWDTAPGAVAWVEESPSGTLRLQRRASDGAEQQVELDVDVVGWRDVQPVEGATVVIASEPNHRLILVPGIDSTSVPLEGCFDDAEGPIEVWDVAPYGSDVLVLGEDGDPDLEARDLWRCPTDGTPGHEWVDDVQWNDEVPGASWRMIAWGTGVLLLPSAGPPHTVTSPGSDPVAVDLPVRYETPVTVQGAGLYFWDGTRQAIARWTGSGLSKVVGGVEVDELSIASGHFVFWEGYPKRRLVVMPVSE